MPDTGALTNMAGTEWTTGKVGGALQFDGSEDHVLVNASSDFYYDAGVSFAAWCKADVVGVRTCHFGQFVPAMVGGVGGGEVVIHATLGAGLFPRPGR